MELAFDITMLVLFLFTLVCSFGIGYTVGAERGFRQGMQKGIAMADEDRLCRLFRKKK